MAGTLAAAPPVSFATRPAVAVSSGVFTLADFDGDGKADIVSVQSTNSENQDFQLEIQLSRGNNRFVPGPVLDLGAVTPTAIAVGDLNGDGLVDVAIASSSARAVYIAFQTAGGGFEINAITIAESLQITANMLIADMNGDKRPDLVLPCTSGAVILLNQGGGSFQARVAVGPESSFVNVADLNGDRHPDLVLSTSQCCSQGLTVLLGDGHGGFYGPATQPYFSASGQGLVVADLNGDGIPDIAGISYNEIDILPGVGDGTFGTGTALALPSNYSGTMLGSADLNGDGRQDVALTGSNGSAYSLITFLSLGKGNFAQPAVFPIQGDSGELVFGDTTGDGAIDVAVGGGYYSDALSILVNSGRGKFTDGQLIPGPFPQFMAAGDFNGDGKPDLAAISENSGLTVYLNTGNTGDLLSPLSPIPYYQGPLVAGDFNGDGREDLVVFNLLTAETLLGNGDGTFFAQAPGVNTVNYADSLVAVDMNGDGKLDLVSNTPEVFLGTGKGQFKAPYVANANSYCYYPGVAVADLNGDGKPDVVSNCNEDLVYYPGNGDGTLGGYQYIGPPTASFAVADVNRDGIADIVFVTTDNFYIAASTGVSILLGNGDGTFKPGPTIAVPLGATGGAVTVGDFNGDGVVDIAVLDSGDSVYSILTGLGDGTFHNPVLYGSGSIPGCMIAAEFHKPAATGLDDLAFCTGGGVMLDLNTTK